MLCEVQILPNNQKNIHEKLGTRDHNASIDIGMEDSKGLG
jgi:hypothetical protein